MSLFWDVLQGLAGNNLPAATDVGSAAASGQGLFGSLTAFFATVTDGKMWRSLGWLILGLLIMAFGINLWLHNPLGRAAGKVGGAAATAAVL